VPSTQIEATEITTWWRETAMGHLRQVIIPYSNLHVSDLILFVWTVWVVLTPEELDVCGVTDGIDDV
jgi:hypothetical protein